MSLPMDRRLARPAAVEVPSGFSRLEAKQLTRLQNAELARGLVAGTRVQAAGMVAAVALHTTAMLSREATFQSDGDPAIANRLNFIVDQFACVAANEVSRFGY